MSGLSRNLIRFYTNSSRICKDHTTKLINNNNNNSIVNKINSSIPSITFKRCYNYYGEGKTHVTVLNQEEGAPLMINSYSMHGFRLNNGHAVIGPIALFPKTVLSWNVSTFKDINLESLSLFFTLEPKLDILVIGIGESTSVVDASFITGIRNKGINVEILTTEHACSTFNFLNMEKRNVAAALIPPKVVKFIDEDIMSTQRRRGHLFQDTSELPIDDIVNDPPRLPPRSGPNPWQKYHDRKAAREEAAKKKWLEDPENKDK